MRGTLSLDVAKLIKGVTPYTLRRCAFCTDDRFVGEIIRDGGIDHCIRKAVSLGLNNIDAIIMATLNACEIYGMRRIKGQSLRHTLPILLLPMI